MQKRPDSRKISPVSSPSDNLTAIPLSKRCLKVFLTTLYISAFAFGGGFVVLGMLRTIFVEKYGWLTDKEMTDTIALAQATPGAISGNALILTGYNIAGICGAVCAFFAALIPPLVILSVFSLFYQAVRDNALAAALLKGMRAGTGAVIISLAFDMLRDAFRNSRKKIAALLIMLAAFVSSFFFGLSAIYIILAAAAAGIVLSFAFSICGKKEGTPS